MAGLRRRTIGIAVSDDFFMQKGIENSEDLFCMMLLDHGYWKGDGTARTHRDEATCQTWYMYQPGPRDILFRRFK